MEQRLKHIFSVIINYSYYILLKLINKKSIRIYYWRETKNFGDLLTPALLKKYGYTPIFFYPNRAQLVATGSLIEHLNTKYSGLILGTGAIEKNTKVSFENARIIGLRGRLTRQLLNIKNEIILGDPGLLAFQLLPFRSTKKYKLGLIPHYAENSKNVFHVINNKFPANTTIIDVKIKPEEVLEQIDQCEYILSSSLHGLICADSLGIPNRWVKLSELMGGDFKFRDYYSVFNIEPEPDRKSVV